jgi:HK97 family phage major capsid protein
MTDLERIYASCFNSWFISGRGEQQIKDMEVKAAMSVGSSPDGGYFTPPVIGKTIQSQLVETSPLRSLARVDTISQGGEYQFLLNVLGCSSGWVGEQQPRPETATPSLAGITMLEGEVYAMPSATRSLLDDSAFDIATFLGDNCSSEFGRQEAAAFVGGDGILKAQGFLARPVSTATDANRPLGTIQYIASGGAAGFAASNPGDQFISTAFALRAPYKAMRENVAWLMNSNTAIVVRSFKDSTGRYIWPENSDALLNFPVELDESMPDIAAGTIPVAFGNWWFGYRILDRGGVSVLRDPITARPKVLFYTRKRVGGSVADTNAIKLIKIATS